MNLDQAKIIAHFLNSHEQHLDKWVIILEKEDENDKYSIGLIGQSTLVLQYKPISILSVIIDRGQYIDKSNKQHSQIRADDNLWEVLYLVYRAVRNGGWDKI